MLDGDIHKGKTIILDYIQSVISLDYNGTKYHYHGTKYGMFLWAFHYVWKLSMVHHCDLSHCPQVSSSRYPVNYNLLPSSQSFSQQIKKHFPLVGETIESYCSMEFHVDPSKKHTLH